MDRAKILNLVKERGPILPAQIRKELGGDTITIGAVLSQLASDGSIQISKIKVGGSPVYYMSEQREKLQDYKEQLNDKQQKALKMLKEAKVLRDSEQEPVIRASLRAIKDFAKPLEVKTKDGSEIFWKWYLTSGEEAKELIREKINVPKDKGKEEISESRKSEKDSSGSSTSSERQRTLSEKDESGKEDSEEDQSQKDLEKKSREESKEDEEVLEETDDDFVMKIRDFFEDNDIEIIEEDIIRKGSEADYIIEVPSPIGKQKYYCKAKGKKKCNDGDLSSAYIQGQTKRLPVLFIMTGKMTNKAEGMLDEEFKGMVVKKI